jgi:putative ABC transport system permease protein
MWPLACGCWSAENGAGIRTGILCWPCAVSDHAGDSPYDSRHEKNHPDVGQQSAVYGIDAKVFAMMQLALRNLFRHRKRTAIALATISFGVIALLLAGGFIEWIFWGMRESTIQSRLGHIQVTRPDYFQAGSADPFAYLLPDELLEQVNLEAEPEVEVVSPRLALTGLISHGEVTIGFIGEGVDAEKDVALSKYLKVIEGEGLDSGDPNGLFLGGGLARNLGVTVGDTVALLATSASGGLNGVEGTVRGLFRSASKEFDDTALRVPIDVARQLLRVSGVHSWVLLLNQTDHTDDVLQQLQLQYPEATSQLQFTPWFVLAEFYQKTVKLFSRQMDVMRVIIALIIILSISNILIMSVLERTGEIGTLMAIGLKRRRILQLFVSEGLLLGIFGGLIGVTAGVVLATVISAVGIPMPPPPGMEGGYTGEILVTWPLVAGTLLLAVLTTLLGSLYPAWKASNMKIVDALRYNR